MATKIIAHRGASKLAPENTMPAFDLAYQQGAEGIETDVQLTKDNVPVLIHDERLKRTTDGEGYIKDFTFDQLKRLDAGSWFSEKFTGTTIPSLDEFLKWIVHKPLYVNIELKNNKINYKSMETIVYEMVNHYQLFERTTLSTFNPSSVKLMKKYTKDMGVALLTSKKDKNLISYAAELGATAIHVKYRLINESLVKHCHKEKMAIRVYTVNKQAQMLKCFSLGCDGIFTDAPHIGLTYRRLFNQ